MFPKNFIELLDTTVTAYGKRVEQTGVQMARNDYLDGLNTELTKVCVNAGYTHDQISNFLPKEVTRAAGAGGGTGEATTGHGTARNDWPPQ